MHDLQVVIRTLVVGDERQSIISQGNGVLYDNLACAHHQSGGGSGAGGIVAVSNFQVVAGNVVIVANQPYAIDSNCNGMVNTDIAFAVDSRAAKCRTRAVDLARDASVGVDGRTVLPTAQAALTRAW